MQIVALGLAGLTSFMAGVLIWSGVYSVTRQAVVDSFASYQTQEDLSATTEGEVARAEEPEATEYGLDRNYHPFDNLPVRTYSEGTVVVPILMYHHIESPPSGAKASVWQLYVSPSEFDRQMEYLYLSEYSIVRLEEVIEALSGGKALPEKSVVITFDDLYQSQIDNALPVLEKFGFKATFFLSVVSHNVKGDNVRAVLDHGHAIGSHAYHHENMRRIGNDALRVEVYDSKQVLESRYGFPIKFFAYPGCHYDAAAEKMLEEAGYLGAVTCVTSYNGQTYEARFHLARRLIDNEFDKFIARVEDRVGMW